MLAGDSGKGNTAVMTALDSIHLFYDTHREELVRAYEQRAAASAERERQLRENPPAQKNTVISYWWGAKPAAQPQKEGVSK